MTKEQLEQKIIDNIKKVMDLCPEYGNYILVSSAKNAISRAMFGKDVMSGTIYVFGRGYGKGKHATSSYQKQLITDEQLAKVEKVYAAMIKNNILKLSRSGQMCKLID